jgi:transposase, IS30 family
MAGYRRLGMDDRVQIQVLTKRGISDAEIARELRVHRSTVGRERQRNKVDGKYYYHQAQAYAEKRQRERKRRPSKLTAAMVAFIEEKLRLGWSPQQIGGWLKHRQAELASVSYERIYWHVWRNKIDGGNLYRHLRRGGRRYRRFGARFDFIHRRTGPIAGRVDIGQRPAIVEKKSRVGDWELDTIVGSQRRGALVSMVERGSKLVRLALVAESKSDFVTAVIERSLAKDIDKVFTLTMDNGPEFARHKIFGASLDADTFFAKPYHAWERGLNEHTNGLVRQYFPKSTDFTVISEDEVLRVEELLNNRPRAVLAFRTPLEVFSNPQLLQPVALAT